MTSERAPGVGEGELAEALHDAMCTTSHHDRPPARCSDWSKYPLIAASVSRRLAATRGEPPEPGPAIDVDMLRTALEAMWSHHTEGVGSSPPSPSDHSYEVLDPFLPGSPDSVATALAAALRDKP